ncbi:adenosine kinase [Candidatus Woesearchaeota archaeon]|nr:adenosine kinase [Candidatus Woesearchaeota archaeon]
MQKKYDVVGIGNPLLDFIVEVEDGILAEMDLNKGEMHLIEADKSKEILKKLERYEVKIAPGGSSANTLAGIGVLGGNAVFLGKIGKDKHGDVYEQKTVDDGVYSKLSRHGGAITGHAITFITPDSERTFATHLGAALHFREEDVFDEEIKASKILHIEGYQLEDEELKKASVHAMKVAKENNVKVSIDLSDPGLIGRNLEGLKQLVKDYADIIFVNEKEAEAFTGKKDEEALHDIYDMCEIAIVKLGEKGSIIKSDDIIYRIPAYKTEVVNTNGAGDMYAAGILFGIANGMSMEKAGKIGSYAASLVVASTGARLNKGDFDVSEI